MTGMQVMKRTLNTPRMDRNKAASPNLALPRSSLNRTCQREEAVRRALDPLCGSRAEVQVHR